MDHLAAARMLQEYLEARKERLRRYDKNKRRDREELDARLDALRDLGSSRIRRKRRSNAGPTVLGILLVLAVLGAIYLIYSAAVTGRGRAGRAGSRSRWSRATRSPSVADKLEAAGVIKSAFVFKLQARYEGYGTEIQTGRYTFEPGQDSGGDPPEARPPARPCPRSR